MATAYLSLKLFIDGMLIFIKSLFGMPGSVGSLYIVLEDTHTHLPPSRTLGEGVLARKSDTPIRPGLLPALDSLVLGCLEFQIAKVTIRLKRWLISETSVGR